MTENRLDSALPEVGRNIFGILAGRHVHDSRLVREFDAAQNRLVFFFLRRESVYAQRNIGAVESMRYRPRVARALAIDAFNACCVAVCRSHENHYDPLAEIWREKAVLLGSGLHMRRERGLRCCPGVGNQVWTRQGANAVP